ncbi:MAG: hypothetical protein RBG13Loki_4267 [Promethearchaeota archaeon CR_4]|nr:MAG: hypothetical protein RBG13Loki_4267 [Candidatus Lokiarchaeota archaeon CR_4]
METPSVLNLIRKVITAQLTIRTDVAYPNQLLVDGKRPVADAAIFESLIPGIVNHMTGKIHEDLFGAFSGSPRMQAVRLQRFMEKHYAPLQPVLGETRFRKIIDFPAKVDSWKLRQVPDAHVQESLVKSATKMYWSAVQRDPRVMESEVSRIMGAVFKNRDLGTLLITERLPALLQKLDLRRASLEIKDLFHDLRIYAGIFYFVDKITVKDALASNRQNTINIIRKGIAQIAQAFGNNPDIQKAFLQP